MRMRRVRQLLKSFTDETRLRAISLLSEQELNVTELCDILGTSQSNLSKHLSRLRLTGVVGDKRRGSYVYYYLRKPKDKAIKGLMTAVTKGLYDVEVIQRDRSRIKKIKSKKN